MRKINRLSLGITTKCDRNCPHCCCGMPLDIKGKDEDIGWIESIAKYFQGLDQLIITGGEPSLHKMFYWITKWVPIWFNPKQLVLATSGANLQEYKNYVSMNNYDIIRMTEYSSKTYKGCKSNAKNIADLKRYLHQIKVEKPIHKTEIGGGQICGMGKNDLVAIQNRKLYPCCVSPGLLPDVGIHIDEYWRVKINKVNMPCNNCVFSEERK